MNTVITSREAILDACRKLIANEGAQSLNIRSVAAQCGISVGSVYHYFASKEELCAAAIESVWHSIFHAGLQGAPPEAFADHIVWLFDGIRREAASYPGFFTAHALLFSGTDKEKARSLMEHTFRHMRQGLAAALEQDPGIPPGVFTGTLSREQFLSFVFSGLFALFLRQDTDCAVFAEIIRRLLYPVTCCPNPVP